VRETTLNEGDFSGHGKLKMSLCLNKHRAMKSYPLLNQAPRCGMEEVSGQLHTRAALTPGKDTAVPIG
jgi:hypothetical protein